jgi:hypothetical protein
MVQGHLFDRPAPRKFPRWTERSSTIWAFHRSFLLYLAYTKIEETACASHQVPTRWEPHDGLSFHTKRTKDTSLQFSKGFDRVRVNKIGNKFFLFVTRVGCVKIQRPFVHVVCDLAFLLQVATTELLF